MIFFPMFKGEILISSYDNLGEIYPLFFHSKHNFEQFLHGQPLSLWKGSLISPSPRVGTTTQ